MINWPMIAQLQDYASPREMFIELYHKRHLTQQMIADHFACSRDAIQAALRHWDVPTKSKGRKSKLDLYLEHNDIQTRNYGIRALCRMIGYRHIRSLKALLKTRGLEWHRGERTKLSSKTVEV